MEVHSHSHTARKKWSHYFWEFFMLFLAVFCGFLAENQREHFIEHKREKQYVMSMLTDLALDTANLHSLINRTTDRLNNYDSLRALLKSPDPLANISRLYYHFLPTTYYDLFIPTRRTIDQLENSGGLRLIRNSRISDTITDYYHLVKGTESQGATWLRYFDQYHDIAFRVFDYSQIDTIFYERGLILTDPKRYSLLSEKPAELKLLYNKLFALRFILQAYFGNILELNEKAEGTLKFLKKEYRVE